MKIVKWVMVAGVRAIIHICDDDGWSDQQLTVEKARSCKAAMILETDSREPTRSIVVLGATVSRSDDDDLRN